MATQPPKPVSQEGVEELRCENDKLRATNEHRRKQLERLSETQRRLVKAHHELGDTFRRLMGRKSTNPSESVRSAREHVERSERARGKDRDEPDEQGG